MSSVQLKLFLFFAKILGRSSATFSSQTLRNFPPFIAALPNQLNTAIALTIDVIILDISYVFLIWATIPGYEEGGGFEPIRNKEIF